MELLERGSESDVPWLENVTKPSQESPVVAIIVLVTAALNTLAALASFYTQIPRWFIVMTAVLGAGGLVVLVYAFVWPRMRIALYERSRRRQLDAISRDLFVDFEGQVQAFKEFISINRNDTLAGYLIELRNQSPVLQAKVPPTPQLTFMSNFFGLFVRQINQWDRSYNGLSELANQFFWFMHEFDGLYVRQQLSAFRTLSKDELPDTARNTIVLYRENYAAFLCDYMSFAKRANAKVGIKPFPESIQLPEPL